MNHNHIKSRLNFYIVLLACLVLTVLATINVHNQVRNQSNNAFDSIVRQVVSAIEERMAIYIDAHYAGIGFLSASEKIDREVRPEGWREFVRAMHLVERYPGINGLGYAVQVEQKDLQKFENSARNLGLKGYKVKPEGLRPNYFAIKFIEPLEANKPALGFDMGSEINRRKAMERARDSGEVTISKKIILVQDAGQTPGFLSYVPLYQGGVIPSSLEERRNKFIGHVYAPFIMNDFIDGIFALELAELAKKIRLEIFNDLERNEGSLIYRSDGLTEQSKSNMLSKEILIDFYGQPWTIRVVTSPEFFDFTGRYLAIFVLIVGLSLSALLLLLIASLNRTREKAEQLAEQMTLELNRNNILLAQSNEELNAFASIASHDLKEPLRTVSSYVGMLLLQLKKIGALTEPDASVEQCQKFILNACKRMSLLIDDLLAFSRVNKDSEQCVNLEKVNCNSLVNSVIAEIQSSIEEKNAEILIKNELPVVLGYATNLYRVFQNLISNAIKYSGDSALVKIYSSALADGSGYQFVIEDNGIGIAEEYYDQIFQLFKRLHGKEKYEGTGLGLAICKKIVEQHNGKIWVESKPNQGSKFIFTIRTQE